ncbi:hypothetical protein SK128_000023 [Halocaridina rubra]|uniref:Uncharacterized protein n=1 Tax=Halocaridina rubra TaxID=373956 RepID=A0AAN8XLB1_HALRR
MVWEPKTCCCCLTPRVGTLVLGWLTVVSAVLSMLSLIQMVTDHSNIIAKCEAALKRPSPGTCAAILNGITGFIAVMDVISLTIGGLLLWGIYKVRPKLMLPYLIVNGFLTALVGLLAFIGIIMLFVYGQWILALVMVVAVGLALLLSVFLLLVVRVCYLEVKQQNLALGGDPSIGYMESKAVNLGRM